jgi:GNAT superfamily N-acetyltransferase
MTDDYQMVTGVEMDPAVAADFWRCVFTEEKSAFIIEHGDWLNRGRENQWFIMSGKETIAYCAVIPADCALSGQRVPALWWVDLIVAPAFRGQGIQSLFDERVRTAAGLLLGIPNELAAKIHRKHQWGVREDGDVLLLPLRPSGVKTVQQAQGRRGNLLRLIAPALSPAAWMWRRRLSSLQTERATHWPEATAGAMAAIFEHYKAQYPVTIYRDAAYWQWRYWEAPYRDELLFYRAGPANAPTHCLVARRVRFGDIRTVRILDLIGDRQDMNGLRELVLLALQAAIDWGATQVTALNFLPELRQFWRSFGFLIRTPGRFCWQSEDKELMARLDADNHWVLGDSDLDAPE